MFENRSIRTDSLENVLENGAVTGFRFAVRLPGDRGVWLSLIGGFYVSVDGGAEYPQSALTLELDGCRYPVARLADYPLTRWGAFREGILYVDCPGGIEAGTHTIDFQTVLLSGYFKARAEWVRHPPIPGDSEPICRFVLTIKSQEVLAS